MGPQVQNLIRHACVEMLVVLRYSVHVVEYDARWLLGDVGIHVANVH